MESMHHALLLQQHQQQQQQQRHHGGSYPDQFPHDADCDFGESKAAEQLALLQAAFQRAQEGTGAVTVRERLVTEGHLSDECRPGAPSEEASDDSLPWLAAVPRRARSLGRLPGRDLTLPALRLGSRRNSDSQLLLTGFDPPHHQQQQHHLLEEHRHHQHHLLQQQRQHEGQQGGQGQVQNDGGLRHAGGGAVVADSSSPALTSSPIAASSSPAPQRSGGGSFLDTHQSAPAWLLQAAAAAAATANVLPLAAGRGGGRSGGGGIIVPELEEAEEAVEAGAGGHNIEGEDGKEAAKADEGTEGEEEEEGAEGREMRRHWQRQRQQQSPAALATGAEEGLEEREVACTMLLGAMFSQKYAATMAAVAAATAAGQHRSAPATAGLPAAPSGGAGSGGSGTSNPPRAKAGVTSTPPPPHAMLGGVRVSPPLRASAPPLPPAKQAPANPAMAAADVALGASNGSDSSSAMLRRNPRKRRLLATRSRTPSPDSRRHAPAQPPTGPRQGAAGELERRPSPRAAAATAATATATVAQGGGGGGRASRGATRGAGARAAAAAGSGRGGPGGVGGRVAYSSPAPSSLAQLVHSVASMVAQWDSQYVGPECIDALERVISGYRQRCGGMLAPHVSQQQQLERTADAHDSTEGVGMNKGLRSSSQQQQFGKAGGGAGSGSGGVAFSEDPHNANNNNGNATNGAHAPGGRTARPLIKMSLAATKKLRPVEMLVLAGLLKDGDLVHYKKKSGTIQAYGTIRGTGILCHRCNQIVGCTEFERCAGSALRRPTQNIFDDGGRSIQDMLAEAERLLCTESSGSGSGQTHQQAHGGGAHSPHASLQSTVH